MPSISFWQSSSSLCGSLEAHMVGFVYQEEYWKHDTGWMHPESAEWLIAIIDQLVEAHLKAMNLE